MSKADIGSRGPTEAGGAAHRLRRGPGLWRFNVLAIAVAGAFCMPAAHALPTGAQTVAGSVTVATPSTQVMNVTESTNKAIVNWNSFSIGAGETVNFIQPNASSVILNRVTGTDYSTIFGQLNANGMVLLVNPAGLYIGRTGQINATGFIGSTLGISDSNFLSGQYTFQNGGTAGRVENQGVINTGTIAALLGPQVVNGGTITARLGSVGVGAGDRVTLDLQGDGLMKLSVDAGTANASVTNSGTIAADGGIVTLSARSTNALLDTVINMSGIITARTLASRNGVITLDGGSAGVVSVSGTLDASGTAPGQTGGSIQVLGDKVGLFNGAVVDASGDAGGGSILIGGNFHGAGPQTNATQTYIDAGASINANAITSGNGGQVAVWSDKTTQFYGAISATGGATGGNGGYVEVSGKQNLVYAGTTDLTAANGLTGTLLLDPDSLAIYHNATTSAGDTNLTIAGAGPFTDSPTGVTNATIADFTINGQLATANVILSTSSGAIADAANVVVAGTHGLTMDSAAGITLAGNYGGTGSLALNFTGGLVLSTGVVLPTGTTAAGGGAAIANTITGPNGSTTYTVTGVNAGSVGTLLTFSNVGNLTGGTGSDTFKVNTAGSLSGAINGGTGTTDTLDYSGSTGTVAVVLTSATAGTATGVAGGFTSVNALNGNDAGGVGTNTTLTGTSTGTTYSLTGTNSGTAGTFAFSNVGNLTGGTGSDTFKVNTAGLLSGAINGGAGIGPIDTLDYSGSTGTVAVALTSATAGTATRVAGGFTSISALNGNDAGGVGTNTTLTGTNTLYILNGANTGNAGLFVYSKVGNLTDTAGGIFQMLTAGSVSGNISAVAGSVNYGSYATPVTFNLNGATAGGTTGIGGTWNGIGTVKGSTANAGADTVTGSGANYSTFSAATKGTFAAGGINFSSFSNINDSGAATVNMAGVTTGGLSGNITTSGGTVTLGTSGTEVNNVNMNGAGTLNLGAGTALVGGTVNTASLSYANYTGPVTFELAGTASATTGITGTWSNITSVTGSASSADVIKGAGQTYIVTGSNAGNNGTVSWTSFENLNDTTGGTLKATSATWTLAGSNSGTVTNLSGSFTGMANLKDTGTGTLIANTGGDTWTLTGSNSGSVTGATDKLTGTFSGMGNLTDKGTGTFNINTFGSLTGNISSVGGLGTLDYTSYANPLSFAIGNAAGATTGIGGTWSGIATVKGSTANSGSNTVTGSGLTYNAFSATTKGSFSAGGISFSSINSIVDSGAATVDMTGVTTGGITQTIFTQGGTITLGTSGAEASNINMNGAGTLNMGAGTATVGPTVNTASLSYANYSGPVTFNLNGGAAAGTTGITGTWTGITSVTGSASAADVIKGAGQTYTVTGSNAGNNGTVSWTSFENLNDTTGGTLKATGATWTLTGSNAGTVTNLTGSFTGMANLVDLGAGSLIANTGGDTWTLTGVNTGSVTGGTGTLTGTFSGMANLQDSANNATSTLAATGADTWTLTGANTGSVTGGTGTLTGTFSGMGNLKDNANTGSLIANTGGDIWTFTGANSGSITGGTGTLSGTFAGMANATDNGAGAINVNSGGSVSGNLKTGGAVSVIGSAAPVLPTVGGTINAGGALNLTSNGGQTLSLAGATISAASMTGTGAGVVNLNAGIYNIGGAVSVQNAQSNGATINAGGPVTLASVTGVGGGPGTVTENGASIGVQSITGTAILGAPIINSQTLVGPATAIFITNTGVVQLGSVTSSGGPLTIFSNASLTPMGAALLTSGNGTISLGFLNSNANIIGSPVQGFNLGNSTNILNIGALSSASTAYLSGPVVLKDAIFRLKTSSSAIPGTGAKALLAPVVIYNGGNSNVIATSEVTEVVVDSLLANTIQQVNEAFEPMLPQGNPAPSAPVINNVKGDDDGLNIPPECAMNDPNCKK